MEKLLILLQGSRYCRQLVLDMKPSAIRSFLMGYFIRIRPKLYLSRRLLFLDYGN